MMLLSMPGFVPAFRAALTRRPDLPRAAFRRAALTERADFARMRVSPELVERWAEFYAGTPPRRARHSAGGVQ